MADKGADRVRRCKVCKIQIPPAAKCETFISKKGFCGLDCATEWGKQAVITKREREHRQKQAEARDRLKTRSDWIRDAQKVVNEYIRLRDDKKPCISCGRHHQGQYHAGHFRTTKAAPNLRFYTLNIWKQCQPCNTHLSGNVTEYRIELCRRIGSERVEWIESQNQPRKYDVDYLKRLMSIFRRKINMKKKLRKSK
jgi:hypothetical protein